MSRILMLILIAIISFSLSACDKSHNNVDFADKQKIVVLNFVEHPVLNKIENSFKRRLREHEISEEYEVISNSAQGHTDNLPSLCRQVVSMKPDIIVTISTPVTQAMMRSIDNKQKLVYTFVTNPEDLGDALTNTNSTGLSDAVNYAGNIDLIKKVYGDNVVIGMIYNPNEANSVYGINLVKRLIKGTKMRLVTSTVKNETDVPQAARLLTGYSTVIYVGGDNTVVGAIKSVIMVAMEKGVPVFASDSGSIEEGAIAGISVDYNKLGIQTADVVKMVISGKDPRDIPRKTLKGDNLVINEKALVAFKLSEERKNSLYKIKNTIK